jgi:hypothetical protein
MTGLGEVLELMQDHHKTKMEVGTRRIDAELDAERASYTNSLVKLGDRFDMVETFEQIVRIGYAQLRNSIKVTPVEPSSSLP